jgi:hypothetical protein
MKKSKKKKVQRGIVKIIGNFGISFFSPLAGGNLAETMFNYNMTLEQIVVLSLFSAIFVTGLSISKEAVEWSRDDDDEEKED